ncbi:phosphotransferase [Salinifilum ghardaiensis]
MCSGVRDAVQDERGVQDGRAGLIRTPEEITAEWLGAVLRRPDLSLVSARPIGTGQMGRCYRATLRTGSGGAESVVVKFASADESSRSLGVDLSIYHREIAFYRDLGGELEGIAPRCHFAEYDEGDGAFTLVLEDVAGAGQGDHIAGCSVGTARMVLRTLAHLQVPALRDPSLPEREYLRPTSRQVDPDRMDALFQRFRERYHERVAPEHLEVCEFVMRAAHAWTPEADTPMGLVHGDYRLDNLLLREHDCRVIDWQTVGWGPLLSDAAFFLGGCLDVDERRAHEEELVRAYHDELVRCGVRDLDWERCWQEYRRWCFRGLIFTIGGPLAVERTERGDELFRVWLERNAQQLIDLDVPALLSR